MPNQLIEYQVNPATIQERKDLSVILAKSGMLGGYKTAEQVYMAIQFGAEIGLSPIAALRSVYVIPGKMPGLTADSMIGLIMSSPDFCGIERKYDDKRQEAETIIKRKINGKVLEFHGSFSFQEAVDAGLTTKDNWKYKKIMLFHRSDAISGRAAYPDRFMGIYNNYELDDMRKVDAEIINPEKSQKTTSVHEKKQKTSKDQENSKITPQDENIDQKTTIDNKANGELKELSEKEKESGVKWIKEVGEVFEDFAQSFVLNETYKYKTIKEMFKMLQIMVYNRLQDAIEAGTETAKRCQSNLLKVGSDSIYKLDYENLVKFWKLFEIIDDVEP